MTARAGGQEFGPGSGYRGGGDDSRSLLEVQVSKLPTDWSYGVRKRDTQEYILGFRSKQLSFLPPAKNYSEICIT